MPSDFSILWYTSVNPLNWRDPPPIPTLISLPVEYGCNGGSKQRKVIKQMLRREFYIKKLHQCTVHKEEWWQSYIVHEPDTKKMAAGVLVPSLLNKVHVDFWEGIHPNSWKMYDSTDHVVACGFYGMCFNTSRKNHIIPVHITPSNQMVLITLYLQASIVVLKPHPLTVTIVTKSTYYY